MLYEPDQTLLDPILGFTSFKQPGFSSHKVCTHELFAAIQNVRTGCPGYILRFSIKKFGNSKLFESALSINEAELKALCEKDVLNTEMAEAILDLINVFIIARYVFDDWDEANEWLHSSWPDLKNNTPASYCDTFFGRRLVVQILQEITDGDHN